jgi:Ubiquitin-conjugating enzyme
MLPLPVVCAVAAAKQMGVEGSIYEGETFQLSVTFPPSYPLEAPDVSARTITDTALRAFCVDMWRKQCPLTAFTVLHHCIIVCVQVFVWRERTAAAPISDAFVHVVLAWVRVPPLATWCR